MKVPAVLMGAGLLALLAAGPAGAADEPVASNKASCAQAVKEARAARESATVTEKLRKELGEMLAIADHLCAQADFVYAGQLLAIARGMVAGK